MKIKKLLPIALMSTALLIGCGGGGGGEKHDATVAINNKAAFEGWKAGEADKTLELSLTLDGKEIAPKAALLDGTLTVSSSNEEVVGVSGLKLSALKAGEARVTVKFYDTTEGFDITVVKGESIVPVDAPSTTENFKLGTYQKNLAKWVYFKGSVNSDTRGEVVEAWDEAVDVTFENAEGGKYYVAFGVANGVKKYFEMDDKHHYAVVETPTAGREWDWNSDIKTVTRTISGTTYFPGTYNNYDTISGCDIAAVGGDFVFQFLYKTETVDPESITIQGATSVSAGDTLQLTAVLAPAGAKGEIVWSVSGDEHVTIDQNGLLTAGADATVGGKVTVTAKFSEEVKGTLEITINEAVNYGTLDNPLTIAQAKALIDASQPNLTAQKIFVKGYVSAAHPAIGPETRGDIWLTSDDGSVEKDFELYSVYSTTAIEANALIGKQVTAEGWGTLFKGTYEFSNKDAAGNYDNGYVKKVEDGSRVPTSVELSESEAFEIKQGENKSVSAKLLPYGASGTIEFAVDPADKGVTYEGGKVVAAETAVVGSYTLKATCGTLEDSVAFTVAAGSHEEYQSVAKYDLNGYVGDKYTQGDGKTAGLTDENALAIFNGTETSVVTTGTNCVTAATGVKAYQAVKDQGAAKRGLKLGTGSAVGSITLTTSKAISKVVITAMAWSSSKLATISINGGEGVALVADDATNPRTIEATFTASNSVVISSSIYSNVLTIELFETVSA